MPKFFKLNDLADRLRIKVDLVIPHLTLESDYDLWAQAFLEKDKWSITDELLECTSVSHEARLFIESFLQSLRLLFELGQLPIFELPKILSLSPDAHVSNKYYIELEILKIDFISQNVYQQTIKACLKLCLWMSQNYPTPENKNKLFITIKEHIVKPLQKLTSTGGSTIPMLRVAYDLGIPFRHLGLGVYQLGWGRKSRKIDRSTCELDSAIGAKLSQNKVATANLLRIAGLPVPVQGTAKTEEEAFAYAKKIGFPVVMKPVDRDRGEGVTVNIFDEAQLKPAFKHAQNITNAKPVLIEKQASGLCHRLFIADGRLLYAVKRHPMLITADGKKSIQQIVDEAVEKDAKKPPWSRSKVMPLDALALKTLEKFGFSPSSIPDHGIRVYLRPIENTEWGGVDEDVTSLVHPENINISCQAANLMGLHIAGIDIISPNISKPWHENGAIINEINFAPLFGGAEISQSYMRTFFSKFLEGQGKIPIEVFSSDAMALEFQKAQIKNGKCCYFINQDKILDNFGQEVVMLSKGLKERMKALVLRSDIDIISMTAQD